MPVIRALQRCTTLLAPAICALQAACTSEPVFPTTWDGGPSGFLLVTTVTTGGSFDVDDFTLRVDGGASAAHDLNSEILLEVSAGEHTLEIGGIAPNCRLESPRRTVSVSAGRTTVVEVTGSCAPDAWLAPNRIVFTSLPESGDWASIVAMNGDGSQRVELSSGRFERGPAVSPDGRRIAFTSDRSGYEEYTPSLYVMNVDGSGLERLEEGASYDPSWSADGRSILFIADIGQWGGEVYRLRSGGDVGPLLRESGLEAASPRSSPDGARIAFVRSEDGLFGGLLSIWVARADGTGLWRATDRILRRLGSTIAWAPDSRRIAYTYVESDFPRPDRPRYVASIKAVSLDGSPDTTLLTTDGDLHDGRLLDVWDWSADGAYLLFTRGGDIYLLRLADNKIVRLTADRRSATPAFMPPAR